MPVSLSKIATNVSTVTIQVTAEDTAIVEYYPGRITERVIQQLNAFSRMTKDTMEQGFSNFNTMLAKLIKSWDVLEDDGSMFPIDAERFGDLPLAFRMQVANAIMGDIRPETIAPQIRN